MIVIRGPHSLTPNFLVALGTLQTRRPASWAGFLSGLGSLASKVGREESARTKWQGGLYFLCLSIPMLSTSSAHAADVAKTAHEVSFLVALLALILVGRLLGEAWARIGQPSVMGQLLAGILLGPSALGLIWPDFQHWLFAASKEQASMLDAISQIGILLLLLLTGMETDLKLVKRIGKTAISISLTGVAVPFACGLALGWLLPESLLPQPERRLL